jgi:hypothetical protein
MDYTDVIAAAATNVKAKSEELETDYPQHIPTHDDLRFDLRPSKCACSIRLTMTSAAHAREQFEKFDRVDESGRGQPHSKTWRTQFDPVRRGSVLECGLGQSGSDLCRFVSGRL